MSPCEGQTTWKHFSLLKREKDKVTETWRQKDRVEGRERTVVKGEVGAERKRPIRLKKCENAHTKMLTAALKNGETKVSFLSIYALFKVSS